MDPKNIRIIFFIPEYCKYEHETSEEMQQAFEACKQNCIKIQWIHESDFKSLKLNKTDISVFQSFEGTCFTKVSSTKSVVVGPLCLLTCLTQGIEIPNFPWPIYSVAMKGCIIATSALPKGQRLEIQTKIQHMGGFYSPDLGRNCTHLVTDSVKSEKYIKAAETGVKIVLPSWIYNVWDASCKETVDCNDDQFVLKHRCPTFHKLVICCTGLSMAQRKEVTKLVEENGGTYREQLHVMSTDVLICNSTTSSHKYSVARKRNIKCVSFDWVKDSVKNGYAMPDTLYSIKISTSTPTKDNLVPPPNFSMISNVANSSQYSNLSETIDGTTLNITNAVMPPPHPSKKRKSNNEHNELVDAINIQNVKMAGSFLDGCGIYLAGFGTEQREKLCKILNFGGATRYDSISERVTHIIVGDVSCHDLKLLAYKDALKSIPVLNVQWLLDSIVAEHPISEEKYIIAANCLTKADSPLSKKGLHVLRQNSSSEERLLNIQVAEPQEHEEVDVARQYLRPNGTVQDDTLAKLLHDAGDFHSKQDGICNQNSKAQVSNEKLSSISKKENEDSLSSAVDDSSQLEPIFKSLQFIIIGFAVDTHEQVKRAIEALQGKVMSKSYNGVSDYAVTPIFSKELLNKPVTEIVTDLWLTECSEENEICPVQYYHKPISIKEGSDPLKGCVVTISNYVNYERAFLRNLIKELGGICQEQLSKINCPKTDVVANTHLITPDATGKKYGAAVKWRMFVINKDWLLECARTSKRAPENLYVVGEAKSSTSATASEQTRNCFIDNINTPKDKSSLQVIEISKPVQVVAPIQLNASLASSKITTPSTTRMDSPMQSNASFASNRNMSPNRDESGAHQSGLPSATMTLQGNISNKSNPGTPVHNIFTQARESRLLESTKKTPSRVLRSVQNNSGVLSQITPVHSILAEARKANLLGTPERLPYPKSWDHVDTPNTPLGAFIRANPSPNLRKQMQRFLNALPDKKVRRDSTPLSELKRKLWDKICPLKDDVAQPNFDTTQDESEEVLERISTPSKSIPENVVHDQLQQFHDMLTASGGRDSNKSSRQSIIPVDASEVKDSQRNTIGWDECIECDTPKRFVPTFMFTGLELDVRQSMTKTLENLGASVSELSTFDPNSTHLICPKPTRNEKILASMAAGKWILHESYVEKCLEAGMLVDEEPFEFGNPKLLDSIQIQSEKENDGKFAPIHYWRKEIQRRGYGPFYDMKAIVISKRKEPIVRVLQAGGAMVIDAEPPFSDTIHATHCILELKSVNDLSVYIPLAERGIYCVNTVFVNDYLQRTVLDVREAIIPDLAKYY